MGPGINTATFALAAALLAGGCSVDDPVRGGEADWRTTSVATEAAAGATTRADATFPGVVACDVAAAGDTIHLLLATVADPAADRKQFRLAHVRSDDGGVTWSAPVAIPTAHGTPAKMHRGDDPQIAVHGNQLIALWTARGDGPFGSGPLATALSDDGGRSWRPGPAPSAQALPAGAALATATINEPSSKKPHGMNGTGPGYRFPAAAAGPEAFHVVWIHAVGEERSLRHARLPFGASGWSEPVVVDPEICACCWNELKVQPDGSVGALYRDQQPSDMSLARSSDGGRTWQPSERAGDFGWHFDGCPHVGGAVAAVGGPGGERILTTVWTGNTGDTGAYLLARDESGAWNAPLRLKANGTAGRNTDVAARPGSDAAVAVWDQLAPEGGQAVYAAVTTDAGQSWSAPLRVSPAGENASYPRVVPTAGRFVVLWTAYGQDGAAALRVGSVAAR